MLKGLGPTMCALLAGRLLRRRASEPVTAAGGAWATRRRAVRAALAALDHRDAASAAVMIEAARSQLGDIDERFAGPSLAGQRRTLEQAGGGRSSRGRSTMSGAVRLPRPRALTLWLAAAPQWEASIEAAQSASLYEPRRFATPPV